MNVLHINQLTKHFGSIKAVDNLSFDVPKGTIYGLLGPNGSGKTTTMGMLLGILNPSSGSYSWFGEAPDAAQRRRIGNLLETPNFYPDLNAIQNLKISCQVKEVDYSHIQRCLEIAGLWGRARDKVKTYSLGMKQRMGVANALLGDPEVLVLDEPTNGLDPQGIAEMRDLIIEVGKQGKTILLASHILDEVERVCSHVAILKKGKLMASGLVHEIIGGGDRVILKSDDLPLLATALRDSPMTSQVKQAGDRVECLLEDEFDSGDLNQFLVQRGIKIKEIFVQKNTLESQFLEITKE